MNLIMLGNYSNANSSPLNQEQMEKLQMEAFQELERILASCNNIDAVMEEVSVWQDKYNIIDIDEFFIDDTLRIKARNLISQKFEEFKKKENEAKELLNMVAQKKTFFRLYNICTEAKNYRNFEDSEVKLKDWLKDHPKNTWNQFNDIYKNYFEKAANEDYLKSITSANLQEKAVSSLKEIADYSIRYSNYEYFQENIDRWLDEYSNRDEYLSQCNKETVERLIKDCYDKLTPPETPVSNLEEFADLNRCNDVPVSNLCFFSI